MLQRVTGDAPRSVAAWAFLASGLFLMVLGLTNVGTAYFSQQLAAAVHAGESKNTAHPKLPSGFIARLAIPRLKAIWFVVDGKSEEDLRRGPGVIPGSVPVGERGNCIIAGHRDTHFRVLKDVLVGDKVTLDTGSELRTYRITSIQVVRQANTAALNAIDGEDRLTLVTCYPFYYVGHAPRRFIVKAAIEK